VVLLDSNIILSASKSYNDSLRDFIARTPHSISLISKIEILGYSYILPYEQKFLKEYFESVSLIALSDEIADVAISLRKIRRITLGDSIIAATALFHNFDLVTNNEQDFFWIEDLNLINPLKNVS
jgi:predicted nucleic acid-binding protein